MNCRQPLKHLDSTYPTQTYEEEEEEKKLCPIHPFL